MNSQNHTDQVVRIGEPCEPSRHHQFSKMLKCAIDEERFKDMLENETQYALIYVIVIVIIYLMGLVTLLLHYTWTKNGQISLFDIYLELLHMLPFKHESHSSFNEDIEIVQSNATPQATFKRISCINRLSPGQKFESSGDTVTINDQQNQEVNTKISSYDNEDLQDTSYQIDPPLFLFSNPLSKKPSIKFLCDQKSLELKNENQKRSSCIKRMSSLDGFPKNDEEFEMSLMLPSMSNIEQNSL